MNEDASRTAVLVCQGRAVADGRLGVGRFADPVALRLLHDDEQAVVRLVRAGSVPRGWRARTAYEMVRACGEVIVPRTVAIDDAVRGGPREQTVILGAGLDGRAWRMPELAGTPVFEVDRPASQLDKRERAAALGGRPPRFVPVDFGRDDLGAALAAAGHRATGRTTWVWEGVIPYLTPAQVGSTVAAVAALSAPGSRLIVNYQVASAGLRVGQLVARAFSAVAGQSSVWAREPWRSAWSPAGLAELLRAHGFTVRSDEDMLTAAAGLAMTPDRRASLAGSRVAVADR
jgi:methyltransferase (TIGR00027 family)